MLDTVLNKAGQSAGDAVGAGAEGVAGGYIGFMLSPWGILVVGLIFLPLQSIPESVMVGTNLGYRCSWVHSLQLALAGGLMVTLAYLGFGVAGVAGAHVVATIFASLGMLAIAIRTLPWFRAAKPRKNEVREFFGFSIWVFASAITNRFPPRTWAAWSPTSTTRASTAATTSSP